MLAVQGYVTLLPLRSSVEQHSWLITTLAVSVIIGAVILIAQGPHALSVKSPFPNFSLLGTQTPTPYRAGGRAGARLVRRAPLVPHAHDTGLAMSAIAQDLEAARAAGIRVRRLQVYAFAISGAIVGSAGFVAAPVMSISADSGIIYVVNGFIAAVIGGLGSNTGALIGGPLVGVASMYAAFQYGGQFQNAVSLALLIAVLMVRPQGLFGRTSARRV